MVGVIEQACVYSAEVKKKKLKALKNISEDKFLFVGLFA